MSYCDVKAKDKSIYNRYEDNRTLAHAAVRMNNWIEKLILFKFDPDKVGAGSTLNAFNFLLHPESGASILSEKHRELVCKNLLKRNFDSNNFVIDLKSYFEPYDIKIKNFSNYTHLLARIVYACQKEWKEEVVALMASDGTGWQDEFIDELGDYDACILWNSKRPSGTAQTLKFLKEILEDGSSFNLYYSSGGYVNYKATIVDFVESQQELDTKKWDKDSKKIMYYHSNYQAYKDDNKKASIVFLASALERISPLAVSDFEFYNGYDIPRQDNLSPVKSEPKDVATISIDLRNGTTNKMEQVINPLNQILFGPPGTGKTYTTINKALQIINEKEEQLLDWTDRKKVKELFDKRLNEGRIVFTTFHQSMSYEDFIEGIKPIEPKVEGQNVIYKVVDGIFKRASEKARENDNLSSLPQDESEGIPFDIAFDIFKQKIENSLLEDPVVTPNEMKKGFVVHLTNSFFSITGINGASIKMMTRTGNEQNTMTKPTLKLIFEDLDNIEKYVSGGMKVYYKALVEEMLEWKNDIKSISQSITPQNYVVILDEINRGNVSQIFGELITLIEDDKRIGAPEALEITLPYSKDKFGVPPNLFIIGTMNTADRSVEALDTALRRRFRFEEMPPRYDLTGLSFEFANVKASDILYMINKRIEKLIDKDHTIGHSYFLLGSNEKPEEKLLTAFYKNIIPLLQEYFFGDYGKIGLVLGQGFVRPKYWDKKDDSFAEFDHENSSDFDDKIVYEIINYIDQKLEYSVKIGNREILMTFEKAIKVLMKQSIE